MEISQSSYHDKKQETEGSGAFYLDQMSYCWARWNTAWCWTCKENLLLNCHSPVSWAVPNSRGRILTIYAKEGCRQSPVTAFAQQEEELLSLLASRDWGSETSPALPQAAAPAPSRMCWGLRNPCRNGGAFRCEVMPEMELHRYFLPSLHFSPPFPSPFPPVSFYCFSLCIFPCGSFNLYITVSLEIPWQLWHFSQQKYVRQSPCLL